MSTIVEFMPDAGSIEAEMIHIEPKPDTLAERRAVVEYLHTMGYQKQAREIAECKHLRRS